MGIKATAAKYLAKRVHKQTLSWSSEARACQEKILHEILHKAQHTQFGEEHDFLRIKNHEVFKAQVPIRDYEQFSPYIQKIIEGGNDILWEGRPLYFAKTSGTTSGAKYIPISIDSIQHFITGARNSLLAYVYEKNDASFLEGKMIFLSGSPELDEKGGIKTGRLSGIVQRHVPAYLQRNRLPSYNTNRIENWEQKLEAIVKETITQNMTLISGIPPWVQMYFDCLIEKSGKKIGDLFPNLKIIAHGGVNFEPYKPKLLESIGRSVADIETYPASEGFIAYQIKQNENGLLLNLNAGIFFEFVPSEEIFSENPKRLMIHEVELGVNYTVVLSSNAGLWAYNLGDTVKFVSRNPFKIIVTGRVKHFISAFGEHVIVEEVEQSMIETAKAFEADIIEFTVAPQITPKEELPYHEWFVEFGKAPENLAKFSEALDKKLRLKNIYYNDLITGKILQPLKINALPKGSFIKYMKSIGKLGGQNKVPRLSNDRKVVEDLIHQIT